MTTWKDRDFMTLKRMILNLFDGEGGVSAGAPEASEPTAEPKGGYTSRKQAAAERERMAQAAMRGNTVEVKTETKKEEPTKAEEPTKTAEEQKPETVQPKTYAEQYEELMKDPEYRKFISEKTQDIFNARYKDYKATKGNFEAVQPLLNALADKYGVAAGDYAAIAKAFDSDNEIYEALGEKNGMSGEQYRKIENMRQTADRERQMRTEIEALYKAEQTARKIQADAELVRQIYPTFDLKTTLANPQVREMLKVGVSLKAAYEAANMEQILTQRKAETEKTVTENIRAKAERPIEGGASPQAGAIVQNRAANLTKAERERLAQRAIRGENITLK